MLKKLKKLLTKSFDLSVVWLPKDEVDQLDKYYPNPDDKKPTYPVLLVSIYNTKQLAISIANCLKGSTNDTSEGNNDSKQSPMPT